MEVITVLGFIAATLSTGAFVPQIIKIWRTKQARDVSLLMFCMTSISSVLWTVYGFVMNAPPIWATNVIVLGLSGFVLYFKLTDAMEVSDAHNG